MIDRQNWLQEEIGPDRFAPDDISEMFVEAGFSSVKHFESLMNAAELYNDTDVTFYMVQK